MQCSKGFTLIELMMVIAIVAVMAAVALPQYVRFIAKSKRAEAVTLLDAAQKSQAAYFSTYDQYFPSQSPVGCTSGPCNRVSATVGNNFFGLGPIKTKLGWEFKGYFGYNKSGATKPGTMGFWISMINNLDGDSTLDSLVVTLGMPLMLSCPQNIPFVYNDDLSAGPFACL